MEVGADVVRQKWMLLRKVRRNYENRLGRVDIFNGRQLAGFAAQKWLPGYLGLATGGLLTAVACLLSLRGVATRLGGGHRIVQMACKIPGIRFACGI